MKHKRRLSSPYTLSLSHTHRSEVKLTLLFKPGGTPAGSEGGQVLNLQRGFEAHGAIYGHTDHKQEVTRKKRLQSSTDDVNIV